MVVDGGEIVVRERERREMRENEIKREEENGWNEVRVLNSEYITCQDFSKKISILIPEL